MFSRNNNTKENYKLEQKQNQSAFNYIFYNSNITPQFQGNGIGISNLHASLLSENYMDIDSQLKGIGSCNFINPPQKVENMSKNLSFLDIYEKKQVAPTTNYSYQNERPFYT
jgi:hypothetical protein